MIIKPIWEDTTYTDRTQSGVFLYHITTQEKIGEDANGNDIYDDITIFNGKAWTAPNDIYTTININHICQDYLSTSLPDIMNITTTTNITHKEAYREFTLWDENDNILEIYRFLLDWSYETKDFEQDINMSHPINGHANDGMLKMATYWESDDESVRTTISYDTNDVAWEGEPIYDSYSAIKYYGGKRVMYVKLSDLRNLAFTHRVEENIRVGGLWGIMINYNRISLTDGVTGPIGYTWDEFTSYLSNGYNNGYMIYKQFGEYVVFTTVNGQKVFEFITQNISQLATLSDDGFVIESGHNYCGDWALYYSNRSGGWDSFLIEGNVKKIDNFEKYYINRSYNNTTMEWGKKVYHNEITTNYELHTGWLNDRQSEILAFNLLSSNQVYLHDLVNNKIIPVVITDDTAEYKTFKNNGRKMVNYTINVEASQIQQNINN